MKRIKKVPVAFKSYFVPPPLPLVGVSEAIAFLALLAFMISIVYRNRGMTLHGMLMLAKASHQNAEQVPRQVL